MVLRGLFLSSKNYRDDNRWGKHFYFILFKEYEVKKDEGFLYIISESPESMESDQEQQCSLFILNNTDN